MEKPDKPTVYMLDPYHPTAIAHAQSLFNLIGPSEDALAEWRQKAEYLLIRSHYITPTDLASAPQLLAIGKQGVGLDKVDIEACAARGVAVLNTPGINANAVAELALTLAMSVARRVRPILQTQEGGVVLKRDEWAGLSLRGKVVGIVGWGNIGKATAGLFQRAFEAQVVVFRPSASASASPSLNDSPTAADGRGFSYTQVSTLEQLLEIADVVSLHVPLTKSTKNMISYPQLEMMKKTAILINTARGGIVNEADLSRALSEDLIFGAGLDVHEQEPPTLQRYNELWTSGAGNIVSLPHIGAMTRETQIETGCAAIDNLHQWIMDRKQAASSRRVD